METISTKKTRDPNPEKEMSFWQHLEELRWHVLRSIIAILAFSILAMMNRKILFDDILLAPKDADFITNRWLCKLADLVSTPALCFKDFSLNIVNLSMSGQFMTHMYISVAAGLVLAVPYVLWEIWRFVKPALKLRERKYSGGAVIVMSLLFLIGILFSYFLIVPLTLNFLGSYTVSDMVQNQISLKSYLSTVVSLTFATGLVFELPVFVYFFSRIGLLTPSFMRKSRKYALVIILIIAAIITPPDVFSQTMVAIPLYGLYEISIFISARVHRQNRELAG
ncbi:MAG TPA: twin-arginine translocase subunit TatC [Bacteroidales bacterium]|nr:twin-arginine translocase subunit TatC [Bacteroidales bacterium]HRZ20643.1 twin-arginine translocase subunit TatC [Bacteroidales bacterium]